MKGNNIFTQFFGILSYYFLNILFCFIMEEYFNSEKHADYLKNNPGSGLLRIQVYTANQAFPLEDVEVKVYKEIDGKRVVFFNGVTDSSGIIDNINLPTKEVKKEVESASDIMSTDYIIEAKYPKTCVAQDYIVSIYDDLKVIQPIKFASVSGGINE